LAEGGACSLRWMFARCALAIRSRHGAILSDGRGADLPVCRGQVLRQRPYPPRQPVGPPCAATLVHPAGYDSGAGQFAHRSVNTGTILRFRTTSLLTDIITRFGVTAHTKIEFDLDNASPAPGVIKKKCHDIRRKVEDELGAQPYEHIHPICGADFFDDLITHSEVEKAYERYLDGASCARARRAAPSSMPSSCSRSTAVGSARSTSPTRARRTSSRSGCRGSSGSTTRRPIWSRPPAPLACRATPSRRWTSRSPAGSAARAVEPLADLHPAARADQGQAHLMTAFQGTVDATFAAFGIDAVHTPAGDEPVPVRGIARRPDAIVGFGDTRIHAETATFEVRGSEVANPRPPRSAHGWRRELRHPRRARAARSRSARMDRGCEASVIGSALR
jgi:Phage major capsid protein E